MSAVFAIDTGGITLPYPAGPPAPGTPVWVTVRPTVRRGATVAADLLVALGKNLTWHGKGRNETEDVRLAQAWIHALQVSALVITNAQEAPLSTLDTLRAITRACDIDLWLLYRAPVDDRTHRKLTKMATATGNLDHVPAAAPRSQKPPAPAPAVVPVPDADFPLFRTLLLADDARFAAAFAAYDDELHRTTATIDDGANVRTALMAAAVRVLRAAPDNGELISRMRALQVIAWRRDHFLAVDTTTLLASVERPRCAGDALDALLMSYRQPQRAIVTALTLRGISLDVMDALSVADVDPAGAFHTIPLTDPTDDLRLAVIAQRHLRTFDGAGPDDRLLAPDAKTLARFVNNAAADLGTNIAGRRVEREIAQATWLKRLGITIKALS